MHRRKMRDTLSHAHPHGTEWLKLPLLTLSYIQ
jgi:hypothetical protein